MKSLLQPLVALQHMAGQKPFRVLGWTSGSARLFLFSHRFIQETKPMIGRRLFTLIASSALIGTALGVASAQILALPTKSTPRPLTTPNVPHIQLNVQTNPAMNDALLRQVSQMPGVVLRDTVISLPGAVGFWVDNAVPLTRPEFIVAGRDFAHMHPDGSMHASLPVELAQP